MLVCIFDGVGDGACVGWDGGEGEEGDLTVKRPREIVPTNLQKAIVDGILCDLCWA